MITDLRISPMLLALETHHNFQRMEQVKHLNLAHKFREKESQKQKQGENPNSSRNGSTNRLNLNKSQQNPIQNRILTTDDDLIGTKTSNNDFEFTLSFDDDEEEYPIYSNNYKNYGNNNNNFNKDCNQFSSNNLAALSHHHDDPTNYNELMILTPALFMPNRHYLHGVACTLRDFFHRYDQSPNISIIRPISSKTHTLWNKWLSQPLYYQQIVVSLQYQALLLFHLHKIFAQKLTPLLDQHKPLIDSLDYYSNNGCWEDICDQNGEKTRIKMT
jgi:hypothetical protein